MHFGATLIFFCMTHYLFISPTMELFSRRRWMWYAPSRGLLCLCQTPKIYAEHAWYHSIHVWLLGRSSFSSLTTKELHGPTSPVGVELLIEKSAYLVPNDICQSSNFVLLLRLNMPPEHVSEVLVLSGNFSELFAVTFPLIGRIAGNRLGPFTTHQCDLNDFHAELYNLLPRTAKIA